MKEEYHKWFSHYLNREFELLVFGHSGQPVILFPPSQARYYTYKDFGLIYSLSSFIDEGRFKFFCPDGIDSESWYNFSIHPEDRVKTHNRYESTILFDVIDFAIYESGSEKVIAGGCDFGGYHAVNFSLRHPDKVKGIISIGGFFNIKQFIYGYYDDNCYFNNPPDYLPNLNDPWFLDKVKSMQIILGTGEWDINLNENKILSDILNKKDIYHQLDIKPNTWHNWNFWRTMMVEYLKKFI